MLETDNLTYGYSARSPGSAKSKPLEGKRALITLDRAQKMDLLIHLLTNLQQPLIVRGPEGIGKTTLLNTFRESHGHIWPICKLQGSASLSFESVITQLSQYLKLSNTGSGFDLSALRTFCEKQKVILLIDDADGLLPGLMGELTDFAASLKGLRLVFSLNDEAFQAKSGSDPAIDACHFVELPPLNQQQCREFLQSLLVTQGNSAQPGTASSFNTITDAQAEELYRQTQGIPGRILAKLPELNRRQNRKPGLWIGIALSIALGGFAVKTWLPFATFETLKPDQPVETLQTVGEQAPITPVAPAQPLTPSETGGITPAGALIPEPLPASLPSPTQTPAVTYPPEHKSPQEAPDQTIIDHAPRESAKTDQAPAPAAAETTSSAEASPALPPKPPAVEEKPKDSVAPTNNIPVETKPIEKPAAVIEQTPPKAKPANAETGESDSDWIMAQPPNHYTMQIMVLSSKASVLRFLKKYAEYRDGLKYYSIGRDDQEKYVLIFGSFPSSSEALRQKTSLPAEFNQALIKPLKQIQKESRRKP